MGNYKLSFFHLPPEIKNIILMYAARSIHHQYPCFQCELKQALAKRHTYSHRVERCKKVARLHIKNYERRKLKYYDIIKTHT